MSIFEKEALMQKRGPQIPTDPNIVELNVGGEIFVTTVHTIGRETSILLAMISGHIQSRRDNQGRLFIDRDPTHFRWILNYLRDGYLITLPASHQDRLELLHEARCFRLVGLVQLIEQHQQSNPTSVNISSTNTLNEVKETPTFLTARPSSKGIFFCPDLKWESFGISRLKEGMGIVGMRFEDGKEEVTFCALTGGDAFAGEFTGVEVVCKFKLILEPKAKSTISLSDNVAENLEALFWWEPSNTQYPQLFGKISRGDTIYLSRGLDFFRTIAD